jgi:competence protein ComEC
MLALVTVAFLIGLLFGAYLPYLPCTILLFLILVALVLALLERHGHLSLRRSTVLFGGLLAGSMYWTLYIAFDTDATPIGAGAPESVRIIGTIVEPVRHAPGRMAVTLSVSDREVGSSTILSHEHIRVNWRQPDRVLFQGDLVELTVRVHPPTGTSNPGGFDYAEYLVHRGIQGVASVTGPEGIVAVASPGAWSRWTVWHLIDEWRNHIREAAVATLSQPALGLFLGMIIGESGYLLPGVRDVFMATGTVHILSISGSHLGFITFLSFFLVKGVCRRLPTSWLLALSRRTTATRLAAAVTVFPVCFYTLLAGAEVATVRSMFMILIFLLAVWLGRAQYLLTALAGSALLILMHDPHALFDISFQLSYCSVLAIAMIVRWRFLEAPDPPLPGGWTQDWLWAWLRNYGWVTVGVTLATLPLVAYHFNQIAWLGCIGNVVVVPLAGMVLVPLGLGSAIWLLVTGGESLPGGSVLEWLFDVMFSAMRWLAQVPWAEWHVASPSLVSMAAFYMLLLVSAWPSQARPIRFGCVLGLVLLLIWWVWSPRGWTGGETVRVTFLDVGQGDASVIELPDGQTVLIDAGTAYDTLDLGRSVVGPFLWDRGIRRLDHVIATHPQLDHVGGLPWIFHAFTVGHYWGNLIEREEPFYGRLREAMRESGLVEQRAEEGQMLISSGACRMQSLNPPFRESSEVDRRSSTSSGKTLNNLSVVLRLDCGPHAFLFTGDVEAEALSRMVDAGQSTAVCIVKVPHHGAKGSVDARWIKQLGTEAAVISVGKHNPYGHPTKAALAAYAAEGIQVFRTDRDGAVWVTGKLSESSLRFSTAREAMPRPVHVGPTLLSNEGRNLVRLWENWSGQAT